MTPLFIRKKQKQNHLSPIQFWGFIKSSSLAWQCVGDKYFHQDASLSFYSLSHKEKFLTPTLVNFWPGWSLLWNGLCLPKMNAFIVVICEFFCCLLTLHRLDSNFENRLLLSQQTLHDGAKLAWWKKLKHRRSLHASFHATTGASHLVVKLEGYHIINTITKAKAC